MSVMPVITEPIGNAKRPLQHLHSTFKCLLGKHRDYFVSSDCGNLPISPLTELHILYLARKSMASWPKPSQNTLALPQFTKRYLPLSESCSLGVLR